MIALKRTNWNLPIVILLLMVLQPLIARRIDFDKEPCAACTKTTATVLHELGYHTESHVLNTPDGYILTMFRVPYGKNSTKLNTRPVLFQHGGNGMSDNEIYTLDKNDDILVTRLADQGYDVWMSNLRGSRYAPHANFSRFEVAYWNFSLDGMAEDCKISIDYILNKTGAPSVSFVGHSLGCWMLNALVCEYPDYNSKIHYAQFMSPVLFTTNNERTFLSANPAHSILGVAGPTVLKIFETLIDNNQLTTFLPLSTTQSKLISHLCFLNPSLKRLCDEANALVTRISIGNDPEMQRQMDREQLEILMEMTTQALSFKLYAHTLQMSIADRIQKYDYRGKNMIAYGQITPPAYDLSQNRLKIRIYCALNDNFYNPMDMENYVTRVPNANVSVQCMNNPKFNHFDFFMGDARLPFMDLAMTDINQFHSSHQHHKTA